MERPLDERGCALREEPESVLAQPLQGQERHHRPFLPVRLTAAQHRAEALEHVLVLQRVPEPVEVGQLPLVRPHLHHGPVRELEVAPEAHAPPLEHHAFTVQSRRRDLPLHRRVRQPPLAPRELHGRAGRARLAAQGPPERERHRRGVVAQVAQRERKRQAQRRCKALHEEVTPRQVQPEHRLDEPPQLPSHLQRDQLEHPARPQLFDDVVTLVEQLTEVARLHQRAALVPVLEVQRRLVQLDRPRLKRGQVRQRETRELVAQQVQPLQDVHHLEHRQPLVDRDAVQLPLHPAPHRLHPPQHAPLRRLHVGVEGQA